MSDGTSDRGAKPPRTLFSLGRTTAKKPDDPAAASSTSGEPTGGDVAVADPGIDLTDPIATDTAETTDTHDDVDTTDTHDDVDTTDTHDAGDAPESGFLCGACEAPLPVGAVFCGECGTPVAGADEHDAEADPDAIAAAVPAADAADATAVEPEPFVPVEESFVPVEESFVPVEEYPSWAAAATIPPATETPDVTGHDEHDEHDGHDEAAAAMVTPAAVLYADPSQAEPLPGKPEGNSWAISAPAIGTSDGDFVSGDAPATNGPAWAVPSADVVGAAPAAAAAAAATVAAGTPPTAGSDTTAAGMPYGHGPVESSEKKSKTGLIIGAAAAAVLVVVVGIVALAAGGGKNDNVQAAQSTPSTAKVNTAAGPSSTTAPSTGAATVTTAPPTTAKPSTTDTPSTEATTPVTEAPTTAATIAVTTPAPTPAPTVAPRPTPAPTTATTIRPGDIVATPGSGQTVNIPKGGTTQIVLQNTGGTSASCAVSGEPGKVSLSRNCGPSIPAGGTITITVTAAPGYEGAARVNGLLEGLGSYSLNIFVKNGA